MHYIEDQFSGQRSVFDESWFGKRDRMDISEAIVEVALFVRLELAVNLRNTQSMSIVLYEHWCSIDIDVELY